MNINDIHLLLYKNKLFCIFNRFIIIYSIFYNIQIIVKYDNYYNIVIKNPAIINDIFLL